jgi:hypothetical protein
MTRSVLSRLLFAAATAVLGAVVGNRVEPTWEYLVEGEEYRLRGRFGRGELNLGWYVEAAKSPPRTGPADPTWTWGGAAAGFGLGLIGRRWRFRGRAFALVLGSLLGMAAGELFAVASLKPRDGRVPAHQADRVLVEGLVVGGAIGLAAAWVLQPLTPRGRPDPAREQPGTVPAAWFFRPNGASGHSQG